MGNPDDRSELSRRGFLSRTAAPAIASAIAGRISVEPAIADATASQALPRGPHPVSFALKINGERHALAIEPRVTLLDAIRETLQMTGTKKGCGQGTCGACTVLVNGRRIDSCLTLAIMHERDEITTIEGLDSSGALHPVQSAFLEHDGFQCGYCTPGQIMSAVGFLSEGRGTEPETIREYMSGNICRCGAYPNIVTAIRDAGSRA